MSENVVIIITTTLGPIILALIGLRAIKLQQKNTIKLDDTAHKVEENTKITNEVKGRVEKVETQTDGMHTEMVKTKQLLGEAVGKAIGRAEQKSETDADNAKISSDAPPPLKLKLSMSLYKW